MTIAANLPDVVRRARADRKKRAANKKLSQFTKGELKELTAWEDALLLEAARTKHGGMTFNLQWYDFRRATSPRSFRAFNRDGAARQFIAKAQTKSNRKPNGKAKKKVIMPRKSYRRIGRPKKRQVLLVVGPYPKGKSKGRRRRVSVYAAQKTYPGMGPSYRSSSGRRSRHSGSRNRITQQSIDKRRR